MIRFFGRLSAVCIILGVLLAACAPASAKGMLYAGKRKKINCGVLAVPGASISGNLGLLFYWLDLNPLKPVGWALDNPLAARIPNTATPDVRTVKADPAYWIVELELAGDLSRFDVLYLPAAGHINLSDRNREKLRKFVDGGGVLWIDNTGPTSNVLDFGDTFFISPFKFQMANGWDSPVNRHHSLVSMPYWLTEMEVAHLGPDAGKCVVYAGFDPSVKVFNTGDPPTSFDVLYSVVVNSQSVGGGGGMRLPSVAANTYGSGRIVATANFVGNGCLSPVPDYAIACNKFAYNIMAWAGESPVHRKNPRHSGSSIDTVGGTKLIQHWTLPAPTGGGAAGGSKWEGSPVVCKNVTFYTIGDTVYALDAFPSEDLDQDGNPDDGLQDTPGATPSTGIPYLGQDVIWMWSPGPGVKLSSPTVVTAQGINDPTTSMEVVLVTASSGDVFMLDAFPYDGTVGQLKGETTNMLPRPFMLVTDANSTPYPPLYINGWIYAVDGKGKLCAYNPTYTVINGAGGSAIDEWMVPTAGAGVTVPESTPRSGPSFGFISNQTNGAVVGVVYWCVSAPTVPAGPENNDFVYSVPVYVSHDRIKPKQVGTTGDYDCRISYKDGNVSPSPKPKVWIRTGNTTTQVPDSEIHYTANMPALPAGMIRITNTQIPSDAIVYAEYALDYATPPGAAMLKLPFRAALEPKSNSTSGVPATTITGTPAVGSDGMIYLHGERAAGSGAAYSGGSVYGLLNDGAQQVTKWNYFLHGAADIAAGPGSTGMGIPAVVTEVIDDPLPGNPDNKTYAPMVNPQPVGSPAVSGDKVFSVVQGDAGGPAAALMCFKANPDFAIRITENAGYDESGKPIKRSKSLTNRSTGRRMMVKIWQPNLMMGAVTAADAQPLLTAIPVPPDMIDYDHGVISFENFDRLKLRGTGVNAAQTNTFSPSLPVWVYLDNTEVPIDMSTWGPASALGMVTQPVTSDSVDLTQWNNLLWYFVAPEFNGQQCLGTSSSPIVIGSTVYFSASYPDVDNDGKADEVLFALNAETGESLGGPTSSDPIWQQIISGGRIDSKDSLSVAGSNGVLLVPAGDGLHAYNNASTLVADTNRVVELDGSGEVQWSAASISWPAALPSGNNLPRRTGPVNKPARVKYIGANELLLVNSGANQVARMDKNGWVALNQFGDAQQTWYVRWLYDKFCDPANLLRPGQPTSLRGPTDAIFWQENEAITAKASTQDDFLLAIHCLIADSGNHRVLDLVYRLKNNKMVDKFGNDIPPFDVAPDRYDSASGYLLPELNWVTKTSSMNDRYIYDCIQLVGGDTVWAAVSNYRTGTSDMPGVTPNQGLGGAIVALGYRSRGAYTDPWDYAAPKSGEVIAACDRVAWTGGGGVRPLAGPRYFEVTQVPDGSGGWRRYMLICDNYGVYKVQIPSSSAPPVVVDALTDERYRSLIRQMTQDNGDPITSPDGLGVPLVANSVQELPNGNWLIANGYSGPDKMGTTYSGSANDFKGEVFEYDLANRAVVWYSPSLVVPEVVPPGGAWNPDVRKQTAKNSYIIQQPRCALRRF